MQRILSRADFKDAMPSVGTPISVVMPVDGKLMAFEAEFVDVAVEATGRLEGVFLMSYEPTGEEASEEKPVVTYVNSAFLASMSWSTDDDRHRLDAVDSLSEASDPGDAETLEHSTANISIDVPKNVDTDATQTLDQSDADVEKLRNIMDDAIAASPRAAIVSQLSSSPGIASLRDVARNTSRLTQ